MWIQQVPKYMLEIAMLIGAAALLLAGKALIDPEQIIAVLAIYLTAAGRLFPSLLRIQSVIFSLQSRQHYASMAHKLFVDLAMLEQHSTSLGFQSSIKGIDVSSIETHHFGANVREATIP
jgi:hypothetical protein